jgi:hypothetical protein
MGRSGALALGAILGLGGASAADAADISDLGAYISSLGGDVFPSGLENWSDLPFRLTVSQSVGYNSNLFNTPANSGGSTTAAQLAYGRPVGGFETISTVMGATTLHWGAQEFILDGSYGMYRYAGHTSLNTAHNSLDAGMNWVLTSKCKGKLIYSQSTVPSQPGDQVSVNALNVLSTQMFNETAQCGITGNWSAVLNSGWSNTTNSATLDQANNSQNVFVAAGITYTVAETNTVELLGTVSHSTYPDRAAVLSTAIGDAAANQSLTDTTLEKINLSYTKNFGPNLAVIASAGLVTGTNGIANAGNSFMGAQPQFSLSARWAWTPKLAFNVSLARVVTPPTAVIGNAQTDESVTLGFNYIVTPKLTFSGTGSWTRSSSGLGTTPNPALQTLFPNLTQSRSYNLNAALNYAITPFLGANLSYQYNRTVQQDRETPSSLVMLALNFAPY